MEQRHAGRRPELSSHPDMKEGFKTDSIQDLKRETLSITSFRSQVLKHIPTLKFIKVFTVIFIFIVCGVFMQWQKNKLFYYLNLLSLQIAATFNYPQS